MTRDAIDPTGLIADSYRIEGITAPECRMIFLDWALSAKDAAGMGAALRVLLVRHADAAPDHPMTAILREAANAPDGTRQQSVARRRGGRAGRHAT